MAYAERYETDTAPRPGPVVKGHLQDTRHTLIETRDALRSILVRLRGHGGLEDGKAGTQPPDPDHIVFIGEQTVQISAEVLRLASEIDEYI